jgi:uncharacterized protein involved in exopolysaccharide biosynthesis
MSELTGSSGEIDETDFGIKEVLRIIWGGRRLVLSSSLACCVVAAFAAFAIPKTYTAASVISPVTTTSSSGGGGAIGGLSSIASQFGGLASLAGVSVPGDSKKYESLAVLQSEALTESYISSNNLLPILFESRWDSVKNEWKDENPNKRPTLWKGNQFFKKNVRSVSTDSKSGLVTVSIKWKDPKTAARWVNDLIRLANESLRDKAIREAENNMSYLNEQAQKTDIVVVRQGIYSLLEDEINKAMMAKGTEEFALKVIDPATPPELPTSPKPVTWVLTGLFAGIFLSSIVLLGRYAWTH